MSAIAAITDGRTVWMGGDSATVCNNDLTIVTAPKVWQSGPWLFGLAGSPRAQQVLQYAFKAPEPSGDGGLYAFMCTTFVDALRQALKDAGIAKKNDERESFEGSYFLAATAGRIFKVWSDYQIGERDGGIDAIGCGEDYLLGSLHATADLGWEPRKRLLTAMEAAEHFSTGVAGPFIIVSEVTYEGGLA